MTDSSIGNIISETMDSAESAEIKPEVVEAQVITPEQPETPSNFIEESDLSKLTPEQLVATRDEWNRAYTAKRQKETAELKEMREKIAQFEAAKAQPQTQTVEDKAEEAKRQVELGKMSISDYTEYMKTLNAEQARQIAREEYESITKEKEESSLAENAKEQFENADPRFDETKLETFDEDLKNDVRRELADLLDEHLEQIGSYKGFDTAKVTKEIIARKDAKADEIIKKRTQESTQAAKMRDAKLRKSEVRGTTSNSQKIGGDSIKDILSETLDSMA